MSALAQLVRAPRAAVEFANVVLTVPDAITAATPRDVVWTYRTTTLYRYRSDRREHAVPVLLAFALINRPDVFDLRPGHSFVEHLLEQGFDVYLLDWGVPDDEDADRGLDSYVCDELRWGIRETLRSSGQDEVTLLGWCIGATLSAMHCALGNPAVRNLVLLTAPIDTRGSIYARWIGHDEFDPEVVTDGFPSVPGPAIDVANKLMKPVANHWTTYRRLWQDVLAGKPVRGSWQPMAKWIADTPPFPGRAYREWLAWMYRDNRLVDGRLRLRDRRVDLRRIDQNLLVVTAAGDHIAPRDGTLPILDLVASEDVTHFDRPGGHVGLMAGSKAKHEIWPDLADWLRERSGR
jgi:polyhydroxyalkanoate synthase subunit PhaC